jgi:Ca-activated chloride channel family protein
MSFGSPLLLASLAVPLLALAGYVWVERRPVRTGIVFPNLAVLASVAGRSGWKRHLVAGLLLGTIAILCVAVARPRLSLDATSDRATVVLVVDVSVSMNATDVAPSRLDAARAAITSFADTVPGRVKVGLVAFADDSVVVTTPTTDRKALKAGVASLSPGFGTAIGDAVARGVELVKLSTGESIPVAGESVDGAPLLDRGDPLGVVVLLSDGAQTRGLLEPDEGARLAQQAGVPVYTIALGTLAGTVTITRDGEQITVPVPPDRETLARIAETTGASTFEATDADKLDGVYDRLGRVVARTEKPQEVTAAFVAVAAALLAAAIGLAGLWAPRLP